LKKSHLILAILAASAAAAAALALRNKPIRKAIKRVVKTIRNEIELTRLAAQQDNLHKGCRRH